MIPTECPSEEELINTYEEDLGQRGEDKDVQISTQVPPGNIDFTVYRMYLDLVFNNRISHCIVLGRITA